MRHNLFYRARHTRRWALAFRYGRAGRRARNVMLARAIRRSFR